MRSALLLAVVLGPLASPLGQGTLPGGVNDASALYPLARNAAVVRFFHVENDQPELAKIAPALAELGAEIHYGPRTSTGRPGHSFFALRAPPGTSEKKLAAALRKGGGAAEELVCTAFDGRQGKDHDFGLGGLGVTKRDFVMGMSGDVVWYDAVGAWSQFYGRPGKLKASELADRYEKLYAPYGGAKLGEVVKDRFRWELPAVPSEKARHAVLGKLEKFACIESATIEQTVLTVTVKLDGLETCGLAGNIASQGDTLDEAGLSVPRAAFDTTAVFDILKAEGLVP